MSGMEGVGGGVLQWSGCFTFAPIRYTSVSMGCTTLFLGHLN